MKKLFPIAALLLLFSACTKEYYTTCDHDYVVSDAYYKTINPNMWIEMPAPSPQSPSADGPYLYYSIEMPGISPNVIDNGVVLAYCIDSGRDNLLPYLRPWGINDYGEPFFQNIRYDLEPGWITFVIEASDMEFPFVPDYPIEFKIVVMQPFRH